MRITLFFKWFIGLVFINFLLAWKLHPFHINPDGVGYFAYLPALLLQKTLWFGDLFESANFFMPVVMTGTGLIGNPFPCGTALLWLPSFWAVKFGSPIFLSSYSGPLFLPYQYATNWSTILYGALCVFFVYDLLKERFSGSAGWISFLSFFGTSLFFYTFFDSNMSHAPSAFTATFFLWIWIKTGIGESSVARWCLLGLAAGFAGTVRLQDAGYSAVLLVDFYMIWKRAEVRKGALGALLFGLFFCAGFFPQLYIWKKTYGSYFANPQSALLSWQFPKFFHILFSPYHGLVWWTPLTFLGILGLCLAAFQKNSDWLYKGLLLGLSVQILAMSMDPVWSQARSFGIRRLTSSVLPVAFGLAFFLQKVRMRGASAIALCMVFWTVQLAVADSYSTINLFSYFSVPELLQAQVQTFSKMRFSDFWAVPQWVRDLSLSFLVLLLMSEAALLGWLAVFIHLLKKARYLFCLLMLAAPLALFQAVLLRSGKSAPPNFSLETTRLAIVSETEFKNHIDLLNHNILFRYYKKRGSWEEANAYFEKIVHSPASDPWSQQLKNGVLK